MIHQADLDELAAALLELDGKEREVVRLRFGLEDDEPRTLQEIGDRLHLSRERVRQIEARAKEKLRARRSYAASSIEAVSWPLSVMFIVTELMPCPLCDDTGWKPVEDDGVRRVVRCDCWREQVVHAGASRDAIFRSATSTARSTNFVAYNESLERASRRRSASPRRFRSSTRGCCFDRAAGRRQDAPGGRGAEAGRCRRPARARLFYDTRDLLRVIRSTYNPSSTTAEIDVLRPVMEARPAGARRSRRGEDLPSGSRRR